MSCTHFLRCSIISQLICTAEVVQRICLTFATGIPDQQGWCFHWNMETRRSPNKGVYRILGLLFNWWIRSKEQRFHVSSVGASSILPSPGLAPSMFGEHIVEICFHCFLFLPCSKQWHKCLSASTVRFHGEVDVPPENVATLISKSAISLRFLWRQC